MCPAELEDEVTADRCGSASHCLPAGATLSRRDEALPAALTTGSLGATRSVCRGDMVAASIAPSTRRPSWQSGRGFLATRTRPSGEETPEISTYASGDGEGRYRSDPKTCAFSSRTPKFEDDAPSADDDYKTRLGPGSYEQPNDEVDERYGTSKTHSSWAKSARGGHVVGARSPAEEAAMPATHFKLADEDAKHWEQYKVSPNVAMSTRMGWGSKRAKRFDMDLFEYKSALGPGDYDAESVKSDRRRHMDREAVSFKSTQKRFDAVRGDGRDPTKDTGTVGPGQYGVPKNPDFEWLKGAIDPETQRPYTLKNDSFFAQSTGIRPRTSRKERHGDPSSLGPGLYWSQSMQDLGSVTRPTSTQSTRGSSGFLASQRKDVRNFLSTHVSHRL